MCKRVLGSALLVIALLSVSVRSAAAQDSGAIVGVGVAFLHGEDVTYTGFAADVAKSVKTMSNGAVSVVGDIGVYKDEITLSSFAGGIRFTGQAGTKTSLFGQFLVGVEHCGFCEETHVLLAPGVGLDYAVAPKLNVRAEVSFHNVRFEGGSSNQQRYFFGISTKLGN
jgi:hypothetical protein